MMVRHILTEERFPHADAEKKEPGATDGEL